MAQAQAQVLIIPPAHDPDGAAAAFVRRCVVWGIDFYFEPGDRLPAGVPRDVAGVRAVFVDASRSDANHAVLDAYRAAGARVYVLRTSADPGVPNGTDAWAAPNLLHMATVDAGLATASEHLRRRLLARDEAALFCQLAQKLKQSRAQLWYDATSYNWDMLLDVAEVTGEDAYAAAAYEQMQRMMRDVANELTNCDCVAPFRPMLRAAARYGDDAVVDYVKRHVDRYLAITPRYRGCLSNFATFCHHARSEVLWQVLPGIMKLAETTGDPAYAHVAGEQFARFRELLFDPSRRTWWHAVGPAGLSGRCWARGAGFVLMANVLLLEMSDAASPGYDVLLRTFREACAPLEAFQSEDGFFYSVLDDPNTQRESSGTAFMAAALLRGRRLGYLDAKYDPVARSACEAVLSRVWDGGFPGHMTATTASRVEGYYHKIQLADTGWAHFALRPMCEMRRGGWKG